MTVGRSAKTIPVVPVFLVRLDLESPPKRKPDKADKGDYADGR
jgi:hypothetical protein